MAILAGMKVLFLKIMGSMFAHISKEAIKRASGFI